MWCSLKPHANLSDSSLKQLRSFLCDLEADSSKTEDAEPQDLSRSVSSDEGSPSVWDDWGTDDEGEEGEAAECSVSWMQQCHIVTSPDAAVIAVAKDSKLAVLHRKSCHVSADDETNVEKFELDCKCEVEDEYGFINRLMCLPVASSQQTQTKPFDWLCICVGTSAGYLLFYTDRGALILCQKFSNANVRSIHFGLVVHGSQQLSVLYTDCMVCIDGLSLYTALRTARTHAARGASVQEISELSELTFEKWKPTSCDLKYAYHCGTGPIRQCKVDQLVTASLNGGFYARAVKPSPPLYAAYCVASTSPYLAFYWRDDGATVCLGGGGHILANQTPPPPPHILAPQAPPLSGGWRGGG